MRWLGVFPIIAVIIWGAYVLWRKERFDFSQDEVFSTLTGLIILGVIGETGGRLVGVEFLGMWVGVLVGLWWRCKKRKWNFWEWWDDLTGSMGGIGLVLAGVMSAWAEAAVLALGWLLALVLEKTYRKMRWYRSGKPGFTGLVYIIWLGLGLTVIAFINEHKLYWFSMIPLLGSIVLYYRSGLGKDLKIWQKLKYKKNM